MKKTCLLVLLITSAAALYAQQVSTTTMNPVHDPASDGAAEEYATLVVSTSYSIGAGSSITVYKPGAAEPEVIKASRKEDFQVTTLRELNKLGEAGWRLVSSHSRVYHLNGSSGTTHDEIVYLFTRKK